MAIYKIKELNHTKDQARRNQADRKEKEKRNRALQLGL